MVDLSPMQSLKALSDGARLRFFTSTEVAEILKMNPQVITRKLQAGEIEGYKLGKDWRVSEAQLIEFLERHRNCRAEGRENSRAEERQNSRATAIPLARKLKKTRPSSLTQSRS